MRRVALLLRQLPRGSAAAPALALASAAVGFATAQAGAGCEAKKPPAALKPVVIPPRPVHRVLRPDMDARIDPSYLVRYDPPGERSGASVIVLPGGNYEEVCLGKEGQHVAVWLNGLGITAYVLRYRTNTEGHYWPSQFEDFTLTMRHVRREAASTGLDPRRVGVIGFSAGGHLASFAATCEDPALRPNAQILVYPTIDVLKPDWWHWNSHEGFPPPSDSTHLRVSPRTPPAFLTVSTTDTICTAEDNCEPYLQKLKEHNVPAEYFLKDMGDHGHGLQGGWTKPCEAWLRSLGWAVR